MATKQIILSAADHEKLIRLLSSLRQTNRLNSRHLKILSEEMNNALIPARDSVPARSQTVLYVPQYSAYNDNMEFSIPVSASDLSTARSGHLDVYFDIGVIQYGPLVIPYG